MNIDPYEIVRRAKVLFWGVLLIVLIFAFWAFVVAMMAKWLIRMDMI